MKKRQMEEQARQMEEEEARLRYICTCVVAEYMCTFVIVVFGFVVDSGKRILMMFSGICGVCVEQTTPG